MNENKRELLELFRSIEWLLRKRYQYHRRVHGPMGDPYRGQGRILSLLKMKPEISQKELTFLLNMRPQSLGELLSKLEQNGYIVRTASETDRRQVDIRLTEAGSEAAEKGGQYTDSDDMFACLSLQEQDTLKEYLNRIIAGLEQNMPEDQFGSDDDETYKWNRKNRVRKHYYGKRYEQPPRNDQKYSPRADFMSHKPESSDTPETDCE